LIAPLPNEVELSSGRGDEEPRGPSVTRRLRVAHVQVGADVEQLVEKGPSLLVGPRVVWADERQEVALALIGEHLDQVREVLALRGELDDGTFGDLADLDPLGKLATAIEEFGEALSRGTELLAELAVGDLEAPDARPTPLGIVHRCGAVGLLEPGDLVAGGADLFVQGAPLGVGCSRPAPAGAR
jgi:hypothetical protein